MNKIISIAPGRTCLFGDHQDYLGLPVIACAISRNVKLTAVENNTRLFVLNMIDINQTRSIDIDEIFTVLTARDYFGSALRVLRRHGCIPDKGYDILISGDIPINSGTSSSSALLLTWINFLVTAFDVDDEVTPEFISYIGYLSEVVEHGEPGGMMDHYSIGIGNIVHIDTRNPCSFTVIGNQLEGLVTGVSGVPKETIGLLGEVKRNAQWSIEIIKENVKDFDLMTTEIADLKYLKNYLPDHLIPYFEAAIKNHHYTKMALIEFQKPILDLKKIGSIMNEHHVVLRDLLKITVPRIDAMIDAALKAGAYGAKIVGSGGGGSIVAMVEPGKESHVAQAMIAAGAIEAYAVTVDPGARIV